jgi:hypothetical protein
MKVPETPYMKNLDQPLTQAEMQIGFISYVVEPTWKVLTTILPECAFLMANIQANKLRYEKERAQALAAAQPVAQPHPTPEPSSEPSIHVAEDEETEEKFEE